MASKAVKKSSKDDSTGILAFLCYLLWPVALVLLLLDKREGDLRYHSINGLGFGLALTIIWWLVSWILWRVWFLADIVWVLALVYAIVLGIKAYNGEKPVVPVVTDLLRKHVKGF